MFYCNNENSKYCVYCDKGFKCEFADFCPNQVFDKPDKEEKEDKQMLETCQQFKQWLESQGKFAKTYPYYVDNYLQQNKEVSTTKIASYYSFLQGKKNNGYINNIMKSLKSYCKFLNIKDVEFPPYLKERASVPQVFTKKELEETIIPCLYDSRKTEKEEKKFEVFFKLWFETALRQGDWFYIKRSQFDFDKNRLTFVAHKTNNVWVKPFTAETGKLVKEYFESEPEEQNAFNLKKSTLDTLVRNLAVESNIKLTTHMFKRSSLSHYATKLSITTLMKKKRINKC